MTLGLDSSEPQQVSKALSTWRIWKQKYLGYTKRKKCCNEKKMEYFKIHYYSNTGISSRTLSSFLFFWSLKLSLILYFFLSFFFFICGGFCHTLKWNIHGFTCVPHPDPPSHLPLHPLPLGFPSATGPSACLMHPTWAGDLFHPR